MTELDSNQKRLSRQNSASGLRQSAKKSATKKKKKTNNFKRPLLPPTDSYPSLNQELQQMQSQKALNDRQLLFGGDNSLESQDKWRRLN